MHAWVLLTLEPSGAPSEEAEQNCWPRRITEEARAAVRSSHPDVRVDEEVVMESPASALLHSSANTELLVAGRRHTGHILPARIGHVVQAAVHHAPRPVAIVPHA
ncbi:universal stress protein [Streptomyces sp. NBC_01456]